MMINFGDPPIVCLKQFASAKILYEFLGEDVIRLECKRISEAIRKRQAFNYGFVYFAKSPRTGLVKIGYSHLPRVRCYHLSTPREDVRLMAFACGSRTAESALHAAFKKYNVWGEWFNPNPAILALIEKLKPYQTRLSRSQAIDATYTRKHWSPPVVDIRTAWKMEPVA